MSDQSQTELQAAAIAEQALKGALGEFKGVDIKVRVHQKGVDWSGVAETGMKVGIGVAGVAGATAVGFGVARLFGFKPGGNNPPPAAP